MKDKRTLSPLRDLSKISGESTSSSQVRGEVYVENAKDKIAAVQEELRQRRIAETTEEEEEVVMNETEEPIPQGHEVNDEQMYTTLANQRATDEVLDTTTLPHATLSRLVARQQAPAAKCSFSPIRA
jgi:succinate dehydrogenase/fumarate reductase flavoprotein subunit